MKAPSVRTFAKPVHPSYGVERFGIYVSLGVDEAILHERREHLAKDDLRSPISRVMYSRHSSAHGPP